MTGEHFIISDTRKVPEFFRSCMEKLGKHDLAHVILDIEGCYPNMPKHDIRQAITDILSSAANDGKTGVKYDFLSHSLSVIAKGIYCFGVNRLFTMSTFESTMRTSRDITLPYTH